MKEQWRDDLVCFVTSLSYDFGDRTGKLHMPQANCCDMNKCVTLFKRIDPRVRLIQTFSAGKLDVVYSEVPGSKDWKSVCYS